MAKFGIVSGNKIIDLIEAKDAKTAELVSGKSCVTQRYISIGFIRDAKTGLFKPAEPEDNLGFDEETWSWIMPEPVIESPVEEEPIA